MSIQASGRVNPLFAWQEAFYVALSLALLGCISGLQAQLYVTGDEVRYLYHAVSLFYEGTLKGTEETWRSYAAIHNLPEIPFTDLASSIHSPTHVPFFTYAAGQWGVESARAFQAVLWIAAFCGMYLSCRRLVKWPIALAAATMASLTLSMLAYGRLLYPDIWLGAIISIAIALGIGARSRTHVNAAAVLALALPFLHIRASLVAGALFVWLLVANRSLFGTTISSQVKGASPMALLSGAALLLFLWYQIALTGSIGGTASAPYSPGLVSFFERLAIQLFDKRHGLLVYSPIFLCAFAGFVLAALRGAREPVYFVAVIILYCASFVWGAASESAPTRFWTAAVPILAIGLAYWFSSIEHKSQFAITIALAIITLVNSFYYIILPNEFLENRAVSLTYDKIYDSVSIFYISHILPSDYFFFESTGLYIDI
jgi:hypothetical protein